MDHLDAMTVSRNLKQTLFRVKHLIDIDQYLFIDILYFIKTLLVLIKEDLAMLRYILIAYVYDERRSSTQHSA